MKYGIFDHLDDAGLPLHEHYENRLRFVEACEKAGFYGYHLAEHHGTPLGYAPSPSVFLAAAIQRTHRLRIGPLLYVLPLHHPLRVFEEVCMLDHMSRGRLDVGVGRGGMPFELALYGKDPEDGAGLYREGYDIIKAAFSSQTVQFAGQHYAIEDFPVTMRPYQLPHPPFWHGTLKPESAVWIARSGANVMSLGSVAVAAAISESFREEWERLDRSAADLPFIGMTRHIIVADTEEEALRIGRRAYTPWRHAMEFLWKRAGAQLSVAGAYPPTFDELLEIGNGIAGTPHTVKAFLENQAKEAKINYIACQMAFGDMAPEEIQRSVSLFSEHIIGEDKTSTTTSRASAS